MKIVGIGSKVWLWVFILLIVAASIGLVFLIQNRPEAVVEEAVEEVALVRVVEAKLQDVANKVRIPATIKPYREAYLSSETAGRVVELKVEKGDRVAKGELLLRIDDSLWKALRAKAAVELADARRDLARYQELVRSGAVSRSELDNLELRRDMAQADHDRAEVELGYCNLSSPIDGVINDRMIELGEYANEGQAVLEVIDLDRVKISMQIPEANILAVSNAGEMEFRVQTYSDMVFTGAVDFVASKADRQSNSFPAELALENTNGLLRAGMIATVELPGERMEDVVVLPLRAIIPEEGEQIVYIAVGDRAERRVVKLETIFGREAVLAAGVAAGEKVVLDGNRELSDGRLISIVD